MELWSGNFLHKYIHTRDYHVITGKLNVRKAQILFLFFLCAELHDSVEK